MSKTNQDFCPCEAYSKGRDRQETQYCMVGYNVVRVYIGKRRGKENYGSVETVGYILCRVVR